MSASGPSGPLVLRFNSQLLEECDQFMPLGPKGAHHGLICFTYAYIGKT